MTEVAGIGPLEGEGGRHGRAVDEMTADRFQKTIRRVRHVAIHAHAAARSELMVGVPEDLPRGERMALEASAIGLHARLQLVIRIAPVHGMTRKTGELAA